MRVFQNANYPIMEWRRRAYIITAVLFAMTIGAMGVNLSQIGSWMNYGGDFTGGTQVQLDIVTPVTVDAIRDAARAAGHNGWEIVRFGGPSEYLVRMPGFSAELTRSSGEMVLNAMTTAF